MVNDFLSTFDNIEIIEIKVHEFKEDEIKFAKRIPDKKDRPIFFLYAIKILEKKPNTFLVTGDENFREAVNKFRQGLSLKLREALEMIGYE